MPDKEAAVGAVDAMWVGPPHQLYNGLMLTHGVIVRDVGFHEVMGSPYWEVVKNKKAVEAAEAVSVLGNRVDYIALELASLLAEEGEAAVEESVAAVTASPSTPPAATQAKEA